MAGSPISIRKTAAGVVFRIRAVPKSSRSEAAGIQGDALKLRLNAPPVEGQANDECIRLLAEILGVKKAQVTIIAGHAARTKTVAVAGISPDAVAAILPRSQKRAEEK